MSNDPTIVIVGGGIAGMTAAAALGQRGFDVTLLESAPSFGEIGAGVTITPNATRGLADIGVSERVAQAGVEPTLQQIQHWQDGRKLVGFDRSTQREKYGAPYVTIHRADLHDILCQAAAHAGANLRCNAQVVGSEGTTALLADGSKVTGDILIGADGVKSVIRNRFEAAAPHFTGHVAWRCLAPVTQKLQHLSDYPGIFIGPGRMINRYNVRGSTILNLVFFARQEGWTDDGWTIRADPQELRSVYAGWCDDAQLLIDASVEQDMYKWAINARQPLSKWVLDDSVTLLGDAAHAMTPFLGQGAACGIEDAIVLARAFEASTSPADALARYEAARKERTTFIQSESNANANRMQGAETEVFGLGNMRDEESLGLFEYDPRTATV